jgi:ribosomal protein S18 acetylase RimI-like enzyme
MQLKPLTPSTFPDLEKIFNARGCSVARGCWCLYYRDTGRPSVPPGSRSRAEHNRLTLRQRVAKGEFIGLVGFRDGEPVGWISLGPREGYRKLERSPVMKPVDGERVWSILCFVVPAEHRRKGVARELLRGAIAYARKKKVKILEAYPVDTARKMDDDSMWFGAKSMYDAEGFKVVARRKPARPVVRLQLARDRSAA